ncbi:protein-disulfide reductase DsbD domain-containing protein [uncultured Algibacter sp.]|uniref:protein-disulfide reductase DsbD domain-containing protein n=1 Tax=uncultured Algibacter sp. TaxID=298659 RepID=UPI00260FEC83|nr:protein-disulfide reductase DsbD domain-containing protein [uncultured Algibacter sp.]
MKKLTLLLLLFTTTSFSQILEPVKWDTAVEKISEEEYNIIFTAIIDDNWHLYSQNVPENGPLPTVFVFNENPNYKLVGKPSEEKGKTVYEAVFEMDVTYFENKAVFKQAIKRNIKEPFTLTGEIEFMACDSQRCTQGYDDFEIEI